MKNVKLILSVILFSSLFSVTAQAQEKAKVETVQGPTQVEKVEAARNEFFAAGKVPSELNEETWTNFKNAVRSFNVLKNSFYKDIKKDQNSNLALKQAPVISKLFKVSR